MSTAMSTDISVDITQSKQDPGVLNLLLSGDLPILKGKKNTCTFASLLIIIVTCSTQPY